MVSIDVSTSYFDLSHPENTKLKSSLTLGRHCNFGPRAIAYILNDALHVGETLASIGSLTRFEQTCMI